MAAFASTPAMANANLLNYGTREHIGIFNKGVEALGEKFNGQAESLRTFLDKVATRAALMGWGNVTNVVIVPGVAMQAGPPVVPAVPAVTRNLIREYGQISIAEVRNAAATYMAVQGRERQNAVMMYHFISNSIEDVVRNKLITREQEYTINGEFDGPTYLKLLVSIVYIDTRATSAHIRMILSSLDEHIAQLDYNVIRFNQFVNEQVDGLRARGEESNDLLVNLFKAYLSAKDQNFSRYVANKRDSYEEGTLALTAEALMLLVENKYKTMVQSGTWNAPSAETEQIIALSAQVAALKKKRINKDDDKKKKKGGKEDDKKKKKKGGRDDEAWMKIPPKAGEAKTKKVGKKDWHWCGKHNKWTRHKEEECKGIAPGNNGGNAGGEPGGTVPSASSLAAFQSVQNVVDWEE